MSEEPKYKPFELVVITKRDIGKTERILLDDNRQFQIKENHLWFVKTDEKTGRYKHTYIPLCHIERIERLEQEEISNETE